jgi:hypothetical protein
MNQSKLFIPTKLKVGFQNRSDTYTKKLSYITYIDEKGKHRKETSWNSWRDHKITPQDHDNSPTEGFVLNKGAGGKAGSWSSWNVRREVVRVWDPRGFEFEIGVDNLLFILAECDSTKGKGLSGEFVYAWNGPELILLPVGSEDYKQSMDFTTLQSGKVGVKDLVAGGTYKTKQQQTLIYLGKFDYHEYSAKYDRKTSSYKRETRASKKFIFLNDKTIVPLPGLTSLAEVVNNIPVTNYADLMDIYTKSKWSSGVKGISDLKVIPTKKSITKEEQKSINEHPSYSRLYENKIDGYFYKKNSDGTYTQITFNQSTDSKWNSKTGTNDYIFKGWYICMQQIVSFKDDKLCILEIDYDKRYESSKSLLNHQTQYKLYSFEDIQKMELYKVYVETESAKININKYI